MNPPKDITDGEWRFSTSPQPNGCPIIGNDRGLMVAMLAHSIHEKDQKEEALANARMMTASKRLAEKLNYALSIIKLQKPSGLGGWNWPLIAEELEKELIKAGYTEEP